ncbi:MAG: hypothetical protein HY742_03830 [Deltaproteobacteria bacterium]|nr:hypothetical protein [Deltaproteobacteria bacterium]
MSVGDRNTAERTNAGAELELFRQAGGRNRGMEFKYEDIPGFHKGE